MNKFNSGRVVITPGALDLMEQIKTDVVYNLKEMPDPALHFLGRHLSGDWGDLCEEDKTENELSLKEGFRLFSAYETKHGKLWIITEHDRSATTLLLPSEY